MASEAELNAMHRAIALATNGFGTTNPNPVVGAVVLDRDGVAVGEGWHAIAGADHAEVIALREAGDRAVGGTIVVSLEPCRHIGRTGPCTDAIRAAGISRVVFAVADPTGEAAGGAQDLRSTGIQVEGGVLAESAERDNHGWLVAHRRNRPHVTWKYAATLDGRTAAADGTSRWITGAASRADVHRERARTDAVIVGIGTVLADDTRLTVRDFPTSRQPLRVVVDGAARTPTSAQILDDTAATLIAVGDDADPMRIARLREHGAEVVMLPRNAGAVDLPGLMAVLYDRGVRVILLEGGARLAGSFVRARLVDRVLGYHAPALLGAGPPVLADAGIGTIAQTLRLTVTDVARIGEDVRIDTVIDTGGR